MKSIIKSFKDISTYEVIRVTKFFMLQLQNTFCYICIIYIVYTYIYDGIHVTKVQKGTYSNHFNNVIYVKKK